jgi:hypothetical protein
MQSAQQQIERDANEQDYRVRHKSSEERQKPEVPLKEHSAHKIADNYAEKWRHQKRNKGAQHEL